MPKGYSIKKELISKSREAALTAVQVFNNPNIKFKSESFIVLMNIAWTYLMHAYYREINVDYKYYQKKGKRKEYDKTKYGAYKNWVLETCLQEKKCPLDQNTKNNLFFLINIRHEIEHQMTQNIDNFISAKFQACCLNYNKYIKNLFGEEFGLDKELSISLQFSSINMDQIEMVNKETDLPKNISSFINNFENDLTDDEYNSPSYSYRVIFIRKLVNHKNQADNVIEFISDLDVSDKVNKTYVVAKESEKRKYLPTEIVKLMQSEGFNNFSMHEHTKLWKKHNAKDPKNGYGYLVAGKQWYYYQKWIDLVRNECKILYNF